MKTLAQFVHRPTRVVIVAAYDEQDSYLLIGDVRIDMSWYFLNAAVGIMLKDSAFVLTAYNKPEDDR